MVEVLLAEQAWSSIKREQKKQLKKLRMALKKEEARITRERAQVGVYFAGAHFGKLEAEKKVIEDSQLAAAELVNLNLRGTSVYLRTSALNDLEITVSKRLWKAYPDCLLSTLFSGRYPIVPQEDGHFFLDADPVAMNHIFDLLR